MNQEQRTEKSDQIKDMIKRQWSRLTDDDIDLYSGHTDQFYEKVREKYGLNKEDAEHCVHDIEMMSDGDWATERNANCL
jgi:uncharacterized protein YjbJ (UPF0337 family)